MSLSVAIIDPDTNVASSAEQTFTSAGFAAHVLGDGDVVEFVRSTNPAVILLNVELQRGSGYSFCNRLKKQADLKGIPIILTSGQETPEAFAQHQRTATAADAYMHKPFSAEQLLDAVAGVLPGAFPNGRQAAGGARAPGAAPALPNRNGQGSGEGDAARRGAASSPLAGAGADAAQPAAGASPPCRR